MIQTPNKTHVLSRVPSGPPPQCRGLAKPSASDLNRAQCWVDAFPSRHRLILQATILYRIRPSSGADRTSATADMAPGDSFALVGPPTTGSPVACAALTLWRRCTRTQQARARGTGWPLPRARRAVRGTGGLRLSGRSAGSRRPRFRAGAHAGDYCARMYLTSLSRDTPGRRYL